MGIRTQGTIVRVATATIAADNITAITAANPPVVTCGTHGIANGAIVVLQNVGGMVQLNDRAFVARNVTATTLELGGVDATTYTAYTSGGTVTEQTMTQIGEVSGLSLFEGEAADIDQTHLLSASVSRLQGLPDPGNCSLNCFVVTDTGQTRLRTLKNTQQAAAFSVTRVDGLVACFYGFVKSFPASMAANSVISGTISMSLAGQEAWFA